jgi:hypothetical protein
VDVLEKLLALVSRYALQSDAVWATLVQVTILDAVSQSLAYYPFDLLFILQKPAADEEGLELEYPVHSFLPCQCQKDAVTQRRPAIRSPLLRWRWQGRRRVGSCQCWRSGWLEEALLEDASGLCQAMGGALGDFVCFYIFSSWNVLQLQILETFFHLSMLLKISCHVLILQSVALV